MVPAILVPRADPTVSGYRQQVMRMCVHVHMYVKSTRVAPTSV